MKNLPKQLDVWLPLIVLAVLAVVYVLMRRIDGSPYGRVLRAIRHMDDVLSVTRTIA